MGRSKKLLFLLLPLALLAYFLWPQKGPPLPREYEILAIPLPEGGVANSATSINEEGQVVGEYFDENMGCFRAFHWSPNHEVVKLFPGWGYQLNDSGQIIGHLDGDPILSCIAQITDGSFDLIRVASPEVTFHGINRAGQLVGEISQGLSDIGFLRGYDPCVWDASGTPNRISLEAKISGEATDINNSGVVTGTLRSYGRSVGFIWDATNGLRELEDLGGGWTEAKSLNDRGYVVGRSSLPNGREHAFVWSYSDGMIDLDTIDSIQSEAIGINSIGQIVGSYDASDPISDAISDWSLEKIFSSSGILREVFVLLTAFFGVDVHAYLWEEGKMYDLNTALDETSEFDSLLEARDINDLGQIVGEGDLDGERRAFLMSPIEVETTAGD